MGWPRRGERQYRIMTDRWSGYEWQVRSFWCPFWHMGEVNSSSTPELATQRAVEYELRLRRKRKNAGFVRNVDMDAACRAAMMEDGE